MSMVKHRATLYAILRKDLPSDSQPRGQDVVCAFAKTPDGAERLCDEYQQNYYDTGGSDVESYFYVVANTFYDQ